MRWYQWPLAPFFFLHEGLHYLAARLLGVEAHLGLTEVFTAPSDDRWKNIVITLAPAAFGASMLAITVVAWWSRGRASDQLLGWSAVAWFWLWWTAASWADIAYVWHYWRTGDWPDVMEVTMAGDYLSTQAVAERLGLSLRRVQALIKSGRLKATKIGRDWLIAPADLEAFAAQPREPGYPKGRPRNAQE